MTDVSDARRAELIAKHFTEAAKSLADVRNRMREVERLILMDNNEPEMAVAVSGAALAALYLANGQASTWTSYATSRRQSKRTTSPFGFE